MFFKVDFSTDSEDHSISLIFREKTALDSTLNIDPDFTIFADYADWKTGDMKPIKRREPVRSRLF